MGRWLRRFWEERGFVVLQSDLGTTLTNEEVVRQADLTFLAVPLSATPAVARTVALLLGPEQALVSIASLMGPSAAALAACAGEAICAHPVFGPTVRELRGLPVVLATVRGERWDRWLAAQLTAAGLAVRKSSPEEHDRAMAVVQALLHSLYVALCQTMTAAGMAPVAALDWASPTMRLQLGLIARILGQDAGLYADLVVGNPWAPDLLEDLAGSLRALASCARAGDTAGFAATFGEARLGFGDLAAGLSEQAEAALERFP